MLIYFPYQHVWRKSQKKYHWNNGKEELTEIVKAIAKEAETEYT